MSSGMSDSPDPAQQVASQAQGQQQQPREFKFQDAVAYVNQVKHRLESQPAMYKMFLGIFNEYKLRRIDMNGVISRVSTLFENHPELIRGFNAFLPPGSEIEVKSQTTTLSGGGNGTSGSGSGSVPLTVNQNHGSTAIMQGELPEEVFQMDNQIQGLSDVREQLIQSLLNYEMGKGKLPESEVYEQLIKLFQDEE